MSETPKNVIAPIDPEFMNIFKWDDKELQKWVTNAIKMQDAHVGDNDLTEFFKQDQTEFDAVQLRICMILFGLKCGKKVSVSA